MNTDIRLSVDFLSHYKTKKVARLWGSDGIVALIALFLHVGKFRPEGILKGMDAHDISDVSGWRGDADEFVSGLCSIGFLEQCEDGIYSVHDWQEHNSWAADAHERSDKARFSRLATVNRQAYDELKTAGVSAISKEDYDLLTIVKRPSDDRRTTVERSFDETVDVSSTPAPAPAPAPAPSPTPYVLTTKDSCPEPSLDAPGPERSDPPDDDPPLMQIPLNEKTKSFDVRQSDVDQWQETFPGVDVLAELRKCRQWSIDNPARRKTKAGIRQHISAWLGKEQDKGISGRRPREPDHLPKATTVAQDLARQRNEGAKRLKAKYGIQGPGYTGGNNDGQAAISGGGEGLAGSLEPRAP